MLNTLHVLSPYLLEKCSGLILRQSQSQLLLLLLSLLLLLLLLLLYIFVVQDCLWFKFYLFLLFLGMVLYNNEFERKEKKI